MCNWICKWYHPGETPFNPEQIGDHFIHILETGYLSTDSNNLEAHDQESFKSKKQSKMVKIQQINRKIKELSLMLGELISDLDKL